MCCSQYEQTSLGKDYGEIREKLIGAMIGLARATEGNDHMVTDSTAEVIMEGLVATADNGNFGDDALLDILDRVDREKRKLVPACYNCAASCGRTSDYDMRKLWNVDAQTRILKIRILLGIYSIAAYAHPAATLGYKDEMIHKFLYKALFAIGMDDWDGEELLPIVEEADEVKRKCMVMLGKAKAEPLSKLQ